MPMAREPMVFRPRRSMSPAQPRSRTRSAVFIAMALALAFEAAHALFGFGGASLDGFVKDGLYTAIEITAVGVCCARVLLRREDRLAWAFMTVGVLTWTGGDLVWTVWLHDVASPPSPSVADALYLAMYPACLLYTSPSPRDRQKSRMPSSA